MSSTALKNACYQFAGVAAPFLHIVDDVHYQQSLELMEELLLEAEDSENDPINVIITVLGQSIENYENQQDELAAFDKASLKNPDDISLLRHLMDQYNLGVADLPEIGSKSMVSRVLSGERGLNKHHIKALSDRFHINPALFF